MKILALDIGDSWTGIAISDPLQMLARPYKTVASKDLKDTLTTILSAEPIITVVVGYPKTLRGTESEQTLKIKNTALKLEAMFSSVTWKLWDERLTSKQAARIQKSKTKEDKLQSHAIAAALILGSYLDHLNFQKNLLE
ncbi:MAG TPA: Holliday junction resolvase RuvX [Candidatus Dependentiae bacterium]|nr:Holliday junction resolvase RuvX [Candidatus Dependentiae bacterium]HRQ62850.1 Holliday junction resolvase RuvX [Candidatus Dependentiae bacterium]